VNRYSQFLAALLLLGASDVVYAQHEHHTAQPASSAWTFMQDGVVFGVYNNQGGPRGGEEFFVPNWWMGMFSRPTGKSQLTLTTMFSLDPATVGKDGYREIFQVGESLNGKPLIDRQHPHDLFMQLGANWRTPINERTGFTLAGGLAAEPALGPVAFMHRASAAEIPLAPLSHHTLDSTHIAFGVVTGALDWGKWTFEGSLFNGREPDEDRWDFDFGKMDSVSGRVWFKPSSEWELQLSTGHLVEPEALEDGNLQRTTASASWMRPRGNGFVAITAAWGANAAHGTTRQAFLTEATRKTGKYSVFGRGEFVQVETGKLLGDDVHVHDETLTDTVGAFTLGGLRDIVSWKGFEGGLGAALTFYAVPERLTSTHGDHPVSFQVFFRLRPPTFGMGRMWNMRMTQPMAGHRMP
jgi:hypothetical protein